jgi:hypothetical protein
MNKTFFKAKLVLEKKYTINLHNLLLIRILVDSSLCSCILRFRIEFLPKINYYKM